MNEKIRIRLSWLYVLSEEKQQKKLTSFLSREIETKFSQNFIIVCAIPHVNF